MPPTKFAARLETYGPRVRSHRHAHHQIVVPLQGSLAMQIGENDGEAQRLQTALIHAGEKHSFQADSDNRFLVVDLARDTDAPRLHTRRMWARALHRPFQELDAHVRAELREFASAQPRVDARSIERFAQRLVTHLLQRVGQREQLSQRMAAALSYAERFCNRPLSVHELAQQANLEVSQFHKLFRAYTGTSPHNYLQRLRAQRALVALGDRRKSLAAVAHECGYPDQSALTRAIKRHHGITPGALRRQTA